MLINGVCVCLVCAYDGTGDFNKAVLDSFDRVRAQQAKLFVDHYTLETEFAKTGFEQPVQEFARSRYEDNEFGTNKPFCESLPQAFETCSQKVDNITSSVEHLSNMVYVQPPPLHLAPCCAPVVRFFPTPRS